jgi:uroporphyrin-III C-methyltransferase
MSLHRISDLVTGLIEHNWDPEIPAAIVERSSCPDQRVTRTKLKHLVEAVEEIGSRPPGLLVVGYACEVLKQNTDPSQKWVVEEGYNTGCDNHVNDLLKCIN